MPMGVTSDRTCGSSSLRHRLFALTALCFIGCSDATDPGEGRPLSPMQTASLQRILDEGAESRGVIGAQATVLMSGRSPWTGATGSSDEVTPMTPGLLVSVGSITKTFVGALVVQLATEGRLALDDRLDRWLPPMTNVPPDVTIEQLLQHTSGIFSFTLAPGFQDSLLADRSRVWTPQELLRSFVGPPNFPPGTAWAASQTNFLLLELIAGAVTGQALGDLLRTRLFTPHGLTSTWLGGDGSPPGPLATGWNGPRGGPYANFNVEYLGPNWYSVERGASGILSTSRDIADWGRALFDGSVLGPAGTALLLDFFPDDHSQPGQTGAGMGVRRYDFLGRVQYGHTGVTPYGSGIVLYDVATGITVAVLTNQNASSHGAAYYDIATALLSAAVEL